MIWHDGEVAVQTRLGVAEFAADLGPKLIHAEIPPPAARFLQEQTLLVISATAEDGKVWTSLVTGTPGFARAIAPNLLELHASFKVGDPVGEILSTSPTAVGTLAIDPATRRRMRVNGRAWIAGETVVIETEQVYSNCPKYIARRRRLPGRLPEHPAPPQRSSEFSTKARELISAADTFFIGSGSTEDGVDASHRGGSPGFVRVAAKDQLIWPDYTGNDLYMTLGNLESNPASGLLFLDWSSGEAISVSGRAKVEWESPLLGEFPEAQRIVRFQLEEAIELGTVNGWSWQLEEPSSFTPPAA